MMEEVWKDIEGYEGRYQVSNLGRVRSLSLGKIAKFRREHEGRVLKPYLTRYGYYLVDLYYETKKKRHYLVHRLVAQAFIPNPDNLPQINHKNEQKTDNRVENLEWCSLVYNLTYNDRQKRVGVTQGKLVEQIDENGNIVATYPSVNEASRQTGIYVSNISACCKGKKGHPRAGGYRWRYKE